jgi:hypothetical protein
MEHLPYPEYTLEINPLKKEVKEIFLLIKSRLLFLSHLSFLRFSRKEEKKKEKSYLNLQKFDFLEIPVPVYRWRNEQEMILI